MHIYLRMRMVPRDGRVGTQKAQGTRAAKLNEELVRSPWDTQKTERLDGTFVPEVPCGTRGQLK